VFLLFTKNLTFVPLYRKFTVNKGLFLALCFFSTLSWAQPPTQSQEAKKKALILVSEAEKTSKSVIWPNVKAHYFFKNLRENVEHPLYVHQGKPTNFCGYAAITHFMVMENPVEYVRLMVDLYQTGTTVTIDRRKLHSSKEIREAAGTLYNKGEMDINHADQIWFMVLADNYKGYLNWRNTSYRPGDESTFWAASNYKKFNRMVRSLTGLEVHARGSDLFGPLMGSYYDFIKEKNEDNTVILYLNNKVLYPNKFFKFILHTPTHFVVLYDLKREGKYNMLDYWDYGLRTQMKLKKNKFRKLVYGITYIENK
jgi:hypothetical protein